jgi:hypothetical protein
VVVEKNVRITERFFDNHYRKGEKGSLNLRQTKSACKNNLFLDRTPGIKNRLKKMSISGYFSN